MKRKLWVGMVMALMATVVLCACSGGGGGGGSSSTDGGGGGGGTIPKEAVTASLTKLTPKLEALQTAETMTNDEVIKAIGEVPELNVLGVSADSDAVWAEVGTNGPLVIVITRKERPYDPDTDPLNQPLAAIMSKISTAPIQTAQKKGIFTKILTPGEAIAGTSVPVGQKVLLMSGFDGTYAYKNPIPLLQQVLTKKDRGYTNFATEPATILNLKTKVNALDVFFYTAHGGVGKIGSVPINDPQYAIQGLYALTTAERVSSGDPIPLGSPEQRKIYEDDIDEHRIAYAYSTTDRIPATQKEKFEWEFAITNEFVKAYWSFNKGSLVYIDACSSTQQKDFIDKVQSKGASMYIGWTEPVLETFSDLRARFIFDRLLGSNWGVYAGTPPQRPFDYLAVDSEMTRRNNAQTEPGSNPPVTITFNPNTKEDSFGILTPSIKYMEVDEKNQQLKIHGIFGKTTDNRKLKVTLNDKEPLTLVPDENTWEEDLVTVNLPPRKSGNVQVWVNDRKSNVVPLTEWHLVVEAKKSEILHILPGTEHNVTVTFDIYFRADVHGYRENSGEQPIYPENIPFTAESGSSAKYVMSAVHGDLCGMPPSLKYYNASGSGTLTELKPYSYSMGYAVGRDYYTCEGAIDSKNKKLKIYFAAMGSQTIEAHTCGQSTYPAKQDGANLVNEFFYTDYDYEHGHIDPDPLSMPCLIISLDDNFVIPGGFASTKKNETTLTLYRKSLSWSVTKPEPLPGDPKSTTAPTKDTER